MATFRVMFDGKWQENFATLDDGRGMGTRRFSDRAQDMGD